MQASGSKPGLLSDRVAVNRRPSTQRWNCCREGTGPDGRITPITAIEALAARMAVSGR